MHAKIAVIAVVYTLFSVASAATYNVSVGENNKNAFQPTYLTGVNSGDTIHFSFVSQIPHSVTQSTFDQPCVTQSGGWDSGVLSNTSSPSEWTMTVTSLSAPLWLYCDVGTHCSGSGMVFAINPTSDQTFNQFQTKAVGGSVSGSSSGGASSSTPRSTSVPTSYRSSSTSSPSASKGNPSATPSSTSAGMNISIRKATIVLAPALLLVVGISL